MQKIDKLSKQLKYAKINQFYIDLDENYGCDNEDLKRCMELIQNKEKKILVHCENGRKSVALSYIMMRSLGMGSEDTLKLIRNCNFDSYGLLNDEIIKNIEKKLS
jgi:protein tyrosine phosphatase (PTP) superfamily phosphohydrolase (DUF442 family)